LPERDLDELLRGAGLPDAGLAGQKHDASPAGARRAQGSPEARHHGVAPDEDPLRIDGRGGAAPTLDRRDEAEADPAHRATEARSVARVAEGPPQVAQRRGDRGFAHVDARPDALADLRARHDAVALLDEQHHQLEGLGGELYDLFAAPQLV